MTADLATVDGRSLRRTRNRDAVVDALLDLLRAGAQRPGPAEIAARAGVSERTVFRLFDDLDALLATAVEHQLAQLAPALDAAPPEGELSERIEAVVEHRAALFERIAPIRRLVIGNAAQRPALLAGPAEVDRRLRAHVVSAFTPELAAERNPDARSTLRHALEAATSWATWDSLRTGSSLGVDRAKNALRKMLTALANQ